MKKATLIKSAANTKIYQLEEPFKGYANIYVWVSQIPIGWYRVYFFGTNEDFSVINWKTLHEVDQKEISFEKALESIGYEV